MVLPNDVITVIGLMSTGILRPFSVRMKRISASHDLQRGTLHLLQSEMGQAVKPAPVLSYAASGESSNPNRFIVAR